MFRDATAFNQPIGNWIVSSVEQMERMFKDATAFNQDLSHWNVDKVFFYDNFDTGSKIEVRNLPIWPDPDEDEEGAIPFFLYALAH